MRLLMIKRTSLRGGEQARVKPNSGCALCSSCCVCAARYNIVCDVAFDALLPRACAWLHLVVKDCFWCSVAPRVCLVTFETKERKKEGGTETGNNLFSEWSVVGTGNGKKDHAGHGCTNGIVWSRPPEAKIWRRKKKNWDVVAHHKRLMTRFSWHISAWQCIVILLNPSFRVSQGQVWRIGQICNPGVNNSTNLYKWVVGGKLVTIQNKFWL